MKGLKLLLWKNWKLHTRNRVSCLFEIFVPVLATLGVAILRSIVKTTPVPQSTIYTPFKIRGNVPHVVRDRCHMVYYTPQNPVTEKLVNMMGQQFFDSQGLNYTFKGFPSNGEMIESYLESMERFSGDLTNASSPVLGAIVFDNLNSPNSLPHNIKYTIRMPSYQRTEYARFKELNNFDPNWHTGRVFQFFGLSGPRSRHSNFGGFPGYFEEGFLYIQMAVDWSITKMLLNGRQQMEYEAYNIRLARFPFPAFRDDAFSFITQIIYPLLFCASMVYPAMGLTRQVIHEKSTRLKEFMKILGLPNWLHWTAWFATSLAIGGVTVLGITVCVKIRLKDDLAIYTDTDPLIIVLICFCFNASLISFAFFISSLFSQSETGATVTGFMVVIQFMPYIKIFGDYRVMSGLVKFFHCLGNIDSCLATALLIVGMREGTGGGVQWDNFWEGVDSKDNFSVGHCICMSLFNAICYSLVAVYVELVFPGEFGVPLPWYFPFTKWYWSGEPREEKEEEAEGGNGGRLRRPKKPNQAIIEKEPKSLKAGVDIRGLTKVFGKKIAVNNLNFKMFEGQVTSLLGHNGAGKTTTMSILTGMITPSSGTAVVNCYDIRNNMPAVRASLGLCPQYNVLFDNLTVEEHLQFFCNLKGYNKAETIEETDRVLDLLGLQDKRGAESKTLSGGMKRKLSVGIAFCAGSKVVLLDEPTAGMDVGARRSTWDLIQAEKSGRTVILSTHYMEEADLLGDRVAIMAEGELQCCGSSLFLKSKYGGDYNLTVVKEDSCNSSVLQSTIKNFVPNATLTKETGTEVSFTLPIANVDKFSSLFHHLDKRMTQLYIENYGLSSMSMEEIFFRVGMEAEEARRRRKRLSKIGEGQSSWSLMSGNSLQSMGQVSAGSCANIFSSTQKIFDHHTSTVDLSCGRRNYQNLRSDGIHLLIQQFRAMVTKRVLMTIRNHQMMALQVVIPGVLTIVALWIMTAFPIMETPAKLRLNFQNTPVLDDTLVAINCLLPASRLCTSLKRMTNGTTGRSLVELNETSIPGFLQEMAETSIHNLNSKYMLAFEESGPYFTFKNGTLTIKRNVTGHFNNQPYHIPPIALNYISNSFLSAFGLSNRITVINWPLYYTAVDKLRSPGNLFSHGYSLAVSICLSLSFLSASFIIFPVQENASKFKHLQLIAGARIGLYWLASLLVDTVILVMASLGILLAVVIRNPPTFQTSDMLVKLFVVCFYSGLPLLLMMAILSTICTKPATVYSRLVSIQLLSACTSLFLLNIMRCPDFNLKDVVDPIHGVLLAVPGYAAGTAIMDMSRNSMLISQCKRMDLVKFCGENPRGACCTLQQHNYFAWAELGIGRQMVYLTVFALVALITLLIQESGSIGMLRERFLRKNVLTATGNGIITDGISMEVMDADVVNESRRIKRSTVTQLSTTDNLILRNLTKVYKNGMVAVDNLSLGVKRGTTFGLLGVNGAGKTTTFKMLTGDISISQGDAYINSYSIRRSLRETRSFMGYCPQFDACIDQLTGRETLTMFARLKGIPEENIDGIIKGIGDTLLFSEFLDKRSGTYSGGNKRKLSTGLSMIGKPAIIFLDEPTAGMDPVARRHVWSAINKVQKGGTSIVITSHNMEECEALCSQLSIMVKGRFQCLGSPQHLRSKLCQGYNLVAQLRYSGLAKNQETSPEDTLPMYDGTSEWDTTLGDFSEYLNEKFPGCILKDSHAGFVQYLLPHEGNNWSKMFSAMEEAKGRFGVEAYSVGQVDLESVFFNFVENH